MTAFADITAAFVAVLSAAPAVSDNIFRARDRSMAEEYATAINVQPVTASRNRGAMHGAPMDWQTKFTIECYARSSVISGDLAVDPLLAAVYARLEADTTLGGMVADIDAHSYEFQFDSQGQKTGWVGITCDVSHRTSNLTLD